MRRFAILAVFVLGCSSPASGPSEPHTEGGAPGDTVQPPADGGVVYEAPDAKPLPLFQTCASTSDCEPGWSCYLEHTAPSWSLYDGGDVYGHCSIFGQDACFMQRSFDCTAADGTCACPKLPSGNYADCTADPKLLVCVPIPR